MTEKYCINCAFFKKSFASNECWHPNNLSLVDIKPDRSAVLLRKMKKFCGPGGGWFKPIETKDDSLLPKTEIEAKPGCPPNQLLAEGTTVPYNPSFTPQDTKEINKKAWWHFWRA